MLCTCGTEILTYAWKVPVEDRTLCPKCHLKKLVHGICTKIKKKQHMIEKEIS